MSAQEIIDSLGSLSLWDVNRVYMASAWECVVRFWPLILLLVPLLVLAIYIEDKKKR